MQTSRNHGLFSAIVSQSCCPALADLAITRSGPFLDRFRYAHGEEPGDEPLPGGYLQTLADATGGEIVNSVLLPDDGALPIVASWARRPSSGPVHRVGRVLIGRHGGTMRGIAEPIRTNVWAMLGEALGLGEPRFGDDDPRLVVRTAIRDVLFTYLCISMLGDDRRAAALDALVATIGIAVPIGTTAIHGGIWLLQRP